MNDEASTVPQVRGKSSWLVALMSPLRLVEMVVLVGSLTLIFAVALALGILFGLYMLVMDMVESK